MPDNKDIEVLKLTESEIRDMALSVGLSEELITPELIQYLLSQADEASIMANEVMYESIRSQLTRNAPEEALEAALALAEREARTLITQMVKTEIEKVGVVIKDGLEKGIGPKQIARNLDMVKGLDSVRAQNYLEFVDFLENQDPPLSAREIEARSERYFDKLLKDRKEVIAHTEARYATEKANELRARAAGKEYKGWITVGDARVSDECYSNEDQGYIPIDEDFRAGAFEPPQHPRCRCTLIYRTIVRPIDRERAKNRANRTKVAKEVAATEQE